MSENGLIHAFLFNQAGRAQRLSAEQAKDWKPEDGIIWLHFDYSSPTTVQWLENHQHLDDISKEFLLSEETRPRTTTISNSLLLSLRGVNLNPGSDPEDMVALRLWADERQIFTSVKRRLLSINDIAASLDQGDGPNNVSEFIIDLTTTLMDRMSETLENIEDRLADIEEKALETGNATLRQELSSIRRESIVIRRYLAPQREALAKLYAEKISWLSEKDRYSLREVADQLIRYIEDLDSIKDRATVVHEELASNLSEQMNNRMYLLSLIAAIFLPLGFLTGLFGINVGGIPGSENKLAFPVFVLALAAISIVLIILFRKKKWI